MAQLRQPRSGSSSIPSRRPIRRLLDLSASGLLRRARGLFRLALAPAALAGMAAIAPAAAGPSPATVPGEILVRYVNPVVPGVRTPVEVALGAEIVREYQMTPMRLIRLGAGADVSAALVVLRANASVVYAEPNYVLHGALVPNDSLFAQQWALHNTGQTGGTAGADLHAPPAWDLSTGSASVLIGVLDSGMEMEHPELVGNLWLNVDESRGIQGDDDDVNGYVDDLHGFDFVNMDGNPEDDGNHGTLVTGAIAATGDNHVGIAGVTWHSQLVVIKVLNSVGEGDVGAALAGLEYARLVGVKVACAAWSGEGHSQFLLDAINAAGQGGMLIVAAAGNDGVDLDTTPRYPASYASPYLLTVGASDATDHLAAFSNYGVTTVDLAAPGVDVLSTHTGFAYGNASGTSMSAGLVTGVCALALSRFPALTNLEVKDLVMRSCDVVDGLVGKVHTGRANAASTIGDPDLTPPGAITDLAAAELGSSFVDLTWTAVGDDSTLGRAAQYELRYSTNPITAQNFAQATLVPIPAPGPAGSAERIEVRGLTYSAAYFFAIRAIDENLNSGALSNVVNVTTLGAPAIVVEPTRLGAGLISGGSSTQFLTIRNVGQGTLDFAIPAPQLQGLVQHADTERSRLKGAPESPPGPPQLESAGGPDAFGYLWSDSDAPSGPSFGWVDITSMTPPVALSGDDTVTAAIPMGMDFPFYGLHFDHVRIGTNGYLSFTSSSGVFDNHPFPTTTGVPNMVAPMWDDFDFGVAHRAYATFTNGRFVVSWIGVPRLGGGGGTYTFQALLWPNGEIRFQYLSLGVTRNSATVGIQNQTRTIGLTVAHNAAYLKDSLCVRIRPVTQWVSVTPSTGRVVAGDSARVEIHLDAVDVPSGGLSARLTVSSNDPARPSFDVPAFLYVVNAPDVVVTPSVVDLDSVILGTQAQASVLVRNRGPLWLQVRAATTSDSSLTATPASFFVPPRSSTLVELRYVPTRTGPFGASLSLWTNDPDFAHVTVPVMATAVTPPAIDVAPESLVVDLFTGLTTARPLRVANRGGGPLDFQTSVTYAPEGPRPSLARAHPETAAPGATALRSGGPDSFGYVYRDSDEPDGPTFHWEDILSVGTVVPMGGDDSNSGPWPIGFDFPFYGVTYSSFRVATNGFLSLSSTSTALVNSPLPDPDAPHDLLAVFWDDLSFGGVPSVIFHSDGERLIVQYQGVVRFGETSPNSFEAILHRDGRIEYQYQSISTPHPDSCTVGIQNAEGLDGLQVIYNAPWVRSGLAVRFQPPRQWLSVTPQQDLVGGGDSVTVTARFDAIGLLAGRYDAILRFESNDPIHAALDVPVHLIVEGAAHVIATPDSLDLGDVFVGYPRTRTIDVQNTGSARLVIASITAGSPAWTVTPDTLSLAPSAHATIHVTLDPASSGDQASTLTIASNDPLQPSLVIPLTGRGLAAPQIVVVPESLTVTLPDAPAPPDQRVTTRTLVVENHGGSPLQWRAAANLSAGSHARVEPTAETVTPLDVEPGKDAPDRARGPQGSGRGGPDAFGYRWIDSDDPDGPPFAWIDISATGTRLALTRDDQSSGAIPLPFTFGFYGHPFDSVRVCGNGWLSFTSDDTTYSNVGLPNAGTRAPANLVAPFWDDLDLKHGGRVYVASDSSRFVVAFLDVPHWIYPGAPAPGTYSFEVVLHPDGEIDFQYLDMRGLVNSATIGIQNAAKDVGLQVNYNQTYARDSLRVNLSSLQSWLAPLTVFGTTAPGGHDSLYVRIDATALVAGDYLGALEVHSNDPGDSVVSIPVRLHVGQPPNGGGSPAVPSEGVSGASDVPKVFAFALGSRHPSPGPTRFALALPERRVVELRIFDVRGALVRRLDPGELPAGRHAIAWDGRNEAGEPARSGVYFVRARAGSWGASLRLALLR